MPVSGKVQDIEREHGKPFTDVLLAALNEHKTEFRTAMALGVYPGTVRWHCRKLGIIRDPQGTWVIASGASRLETVHIRTIRRPKVPVSGKVQDIEREHGKPFTDVLLAALNEHKTEFRTAIALGVYPGTVRWHCRKLGLIRDPQGTWVIASKDV